MLGWKDEKGQSQLFFLSLLDFSLSHSWGKLQSGLQGPFKGGFERSNVMQDKTDLVQKKGMCQGSEYSHHPDSFRSHACGGSVSVG